MDPVARALAHESYARKRLAKQVPSVTVGLATTDASLEDDLQDWHGLSDSLESSDVSRGTALKGPDRPTVLQQPQVPAAAEPEPHLPVEKKQKKTVGVTKGAWRAEKEAIAGLPRLDCVPSTFSVADKFLLDIEAFARRFQSTSELFEIAESQMDTTVFYFFDRRMKAMFPGSDRDYKTLAKAMSKLACLRDPESLLNKSLEEIPQGDIGALELYGKVGLAHDSYVRFCERTESPVSITEESLAAKYISLLPREVSSTTKSLAESRGNPGLFYCAEIAVAATKIEKPRSRNNYY